MKPDIHATKHQQSVHSIHGTPELKVNINNVPIPVHIDSGASVKRMDKRITLKKSKTQIYSFGSKTPLAIIRELETTVESRDKLLPVTFYLTDGNHSSQLSHATATELGVLQVDAAVHMVEPNPQPVPCPEIQKLVEEYADLFSGIGKLRHGSVQIHIDKSIPQLCSITAAYLSTSLIRLKRSWNVGAGWHN